MMKKLFSLGLIAATLISCKEKPTPGAEVYPTDGLTLEAKTNAFLITGYDPTSPATVPYDILRKQFENEYGKRLGNMSVVTTGALGTQLASDITANFQSPFSPFFILNGKEPDLTMFVEEFEKATEGKPLLSVAHKVTENDTAWLVDSKVKLWKDTVYAGIFIETYMMAQIPARNYPNLDLRVPELKDYLDTTGKSSFWIKDVPNADSTGFLFKKGDEFQHNYILISSFNEDEPFGTSLTQYSPFHAEFFENDVIGTRDTPIRHHFLKPEKGDFDFEFKAQFITVVWIFDSVTSSLKYVNSFATE